MTQPKFQETVSQGNQLRLHMPQISKIRVDAIQYANPVPSLIQTPCQTPKPKVQQDDKVLRVRVGRIAATECLADTKTAPRTTIHVASQCFLQGRLRYGCI